MKEQESKGIKKHKGNQLSKIGDSIKIVDKLLQKTPSWDKFFEEQLKKQYYKDLNSFLDEEYSNFGVAISPKRSEIYKAFDLTPFDKLKVVIIEWDPHPTSRTKDGLAFSSPDTALLPKTLQNVYREITTDIGVDLREQNGDLTRWAKQGVFLLRTVITHNSEQVGKHQSKGWEVFSEEVIKYINANKKNVVYLLWGSRPSKMGEYISDDENLVLNAPNPSPLSAYRGFFGCKHFSKANDYLISHNKKPIDWKADIKSEEI